MRISGIQYNEQYMALEVYVSGCKPPHCPGCHNAEAHSFDVGMFPVVALTIINKKLADYGKAIKRIWILGGEPLDQNLIELEEFIKSLPYLKYETMIWTRYYAEQFNNEQLDFVEGYFDVMKNGPYVKDLPSWEATLPDGQIVKLASQNQTITKL